MSFTSVTPYIIPAWQDGAAPAVSAQKLTDIGNGIVSAQTAAVEAQIAVTALDGRETTSEANITSLQGRMTAAESKIRSTIKVQTDPSASVTAVCNGTTVGPVVASNVGLASLDVPFYGNWHVTVVATAGTVQENVKVTGLGEFPVFMFASACGVEWGRTATPVWTRTGFAANFPDPVPYMAGLTSAQYGSPFDNIYPWSGMVRSTHPVMGEVVAIPRFYYKWTVTDSSMKLEISEHKLDGFSVSPAHKNRGDGKGIRDVVYIGRYHCDGQYHSTSGALPKVNITRATARSGISQIVSEAWQMDFAMWWTIQMLYMVEFANMNSQATIGYGCGNNSTVEAMGYTDSMPYHTGTMLSSRTSYGASTQYRNIEGLWDNCLDWCDGIYFNGASTYVIMNPADFSDTTGGAFVGTRTTESGWIKGFTFPQNTGYEWAGYPGSGDLGGGESSYFCDYSWNSSGGVVLCVGGYCYRDLGRGLFCRGGSDGASGASSSVGSRLMILP